jgi:thiol-disulfide isomerase/thioredoxin
MLRLFTGFVFVAILFVLACQLPGKLVQSIRRSSSSPFPTLSPSNTSEKNTVQPGSNKATPIVFSTATLTLALLTGESAYPGIETPGPIIASPTGQASAPAPYPGSEQGQVTQPVDNTYPGQIGVTPAGSEGSYPAPGSPVASVVSPTAPISVQGTAIPTSSTTPSLEAKQSSPTPTKTQLTGQEAPQQSTTPPMSASPSATLIPQTQTPTPSATFFVPTETPTPTRTPFLTPTPTITFTPTPTRTPLPAPPWISVRLRATNPHTVQLVAGKPQLIEFFAFWSGPSLAMAPVVQGIEKEYTGRVNFIYLDIDDPATDLFKQLLRYRVEPHFFLLDAHGKVLQQWVGYVTVEQFRQSLDSALP